MMQLSGATLSFNGNRHCFITLPRSVSSKLPREKVVTIKLQNTNGVILYGSWNGSVSIGASQSNEIVEINGLFGNKQGFHDGDEVVISVLPDVPSCSQIAVEPVSPDDWEILELHSAQVEGNLLDQLRVVWCGQVFPVWIQRSICVFVKIRKMSPDVECSLLQQNSEVIVSPKVRFGSNQATTTKAADNGSHSAVVNSSVTPQQPTIQEGLDKRDSVDSDESVLSGDHLSSEVTERSSASEKGSAVSRTFHGALSLLKNIWYGDPFKDDEERKKEHLVVDDASEYLSDCYKFETSLRTLPLEDFILGCNYNSSPSFLSQPSNVYISGQTFITKLCPRGNPPPKLPVSFLAILKKLSSPSEKRERAKREEEKQSRGRARSNLENTEITLGQDQECKHSRGCLVRVVVLDMTTKENGSNQNTRFAGVTCNKWLAADQVLVSEELRKQLALDVTGRISVLSLYQRQLTHSLPTSIDIFPLKNLPQGFTPELLEIAFKEWVNQISSIHFPLVASSGSLLTCPLTSDTDMDLFISLRYAQSSTELTVYQDLQFSFIYPECLSNVSCKVKEPMLPETALSGSTMSTLWGTRQIDPELPTVTLKQLGGVDDISQLALGYVEMCLGQRPLALELQKDARGLQFGGLLILGNRGVGKSVFARALCRSLAGFPNSAFVTVVECKTLRGKRVESLRRMMEQILNEAHWRQPSVLLLDDLDLIAAAPSGPEQEMSGEALYYAKIAELVKDLFKAEVQCGSCISVIATAKSRTAIHPSLVAPSGHHFFQEIVEIKPPNHVLRVLILEAALTNRTMVKLQCVKQIDLNAVAQQTEGFVARDLDSLVSRAIHCHLSQQSHSGSKEICLSNADFTSALDGFKPMALRNVPLHEGGESGWECVGGLHEVRNALVQTLQWPAKYPKLFASCPLRLRSGLLLYGAPGTGKTLLASVVAKECNLNFISIKGPELLSKYIGASEQAVRDTFNRAQSAKPCILFFDEFDSLAPRRGHDSTGVTDRVVNQLLTQLDGVEGLEGVYVLAATSRPDLIDPALLRPGRLDKALHCPIPNKDERLEILKALTRSMLLANDVDLTWLAENTEFFTGADFKALLFNAQLEAIHNHTGTLLTGDKDSKAASGCKHNFEMTFIPNLEEGIKHDLEPEHVQKVQEQVMRVLPQKKEQANIDSTRQAPSIFVTQKYLIMALENSRPSVTAAERLKYRKIYESFVASRGGNFTDTMQNVGKRATLA